MSPLIPPFAALRAFEAVGRLGGFRKAATMIGISHSLVSRHVATLEDQLGVTLYNRVDRVLTPAGQIYHSRISTALQIIEQATSELRNQQGQLVITCAPGLALHWLAARLHAFRSNCPDVTVELRSRDTPPDLNAGEADGDIRYITGAVHEDAARVVIELARPVVLPVASPGFLSTLRAPIRNAATLLTLPLIEEESMREWRDWFASQGIDDVVHGGKARYGHAQLALAAARAGQGIALANHYLIDEDLATGRLVRIQPTEQSFKPVSLGAYVMSTDRRRSQDRPLRLFGRWISAEFAGDSDPETSDACACRLEPP